MVDERARETIFMWYSLFNLPHRESVAAVHDRVVTPDYTSCTGDGPADCWNKEKSIQVITGFETSIPDMKFEIKERFACDDHVIVRGEVTFRRSDVEERIAVLQDCDCFGDIAP